MYVGRFANAAVAALAVPALALVPGSAAQHVKPVTSKTYAVTVSVPTSWTRTPYSGSFAYDGATGFMVVTAAMEPRGLKAACKAAATDNVLHPFGKHPRVAYRKIDGRPGCVISPSADAPRAPVRKGGPSFQTSESLVAYRRPLNIGGTKYALLALFANPARMNGLLASLRLHH